MSCTNKLLVKYAVEFRRAPEPDDGEDAVIRPVFFMFTLVIFVLPLSVVFERA